MMGGQCRFPPPCVQEFGACSINSRKFAAGRDAEQGIALPCFARLIVGLSIKLRLLGGSLCVPSSFLPLHCQDVRAAIPSLLGACSRRTCMPIVR
jgi:hypothetical protein